MRAEFVVVGESTDLNIKNRAKGILWAKISAKGKTAHGAYPWRGENAIWKMNEFLNCLKRQYPVLKKEKWVTTVNVASIGTGNKALNKIPDNCEVWLDLRYVPEDAKTIMGDLRRLLSGELKMEVVAQEPAMLTDENNPHLQLLKRETERAVGKKVRILSANGSSDARHFTSVNCPGVEFGPVGGGISSDEEWVDVPGLETYCRVLEKFLLEGIS